jgi:hypothetical protein
VIVIVPAPPIQDRQTLTSRHQNPGVLRTPLTLQAEGRHELSVGRAADRIGSRGLFLFGLV